ncbi:hypothetical protein KBB96_19540 [Luteolibacter ambystomatis]|uniref:Secreted protein n=1 Tax=Luteolibacter ambystomatis TaxID=2824561 RepID=A0A975G930_9BACT|nr:hypothetical protein [Luteolibacter ambystomatis]QUE51036.1 hypothetical protein KBB96_19540 [Luteolibacter ambystomatis]
MNPAVVSKSLLALAAAALLPSCAGPSCWEGGIPLRSGGETEAQAHAAAEVRAAENVTVYRGLAHPQNEKALYRRQLKTVQHTHIHGFDFFSKPADVPKATVRKILDLYVDPTSHQALSTKDLCHYHPDYAFVWKTGAQEHVLQICYGCHEWRYFCERGALCTDINEPAYFDKLTKWLPKSTAKE